MIDLYEVLYPRVHYVDEKDFENKRKSVAGMIKRGYPAIVYNDGSVGIWGMSVSDEYFNAVVEQNKEYIVATIIRHHVCKPNCCCYNNISKMESEQV